MTEAMLALMICVFVFLVAIKLSYTQYCDKDKSANFIVKCAEAANPMSDEEGEDLVEECGNQARLIFCEFKKK